MKKHLMLENIEGEGIQLKKFNDFYEIYLVEDDYYINFSPEEMNSFLEELTKYVKENE